MLKEASAPEVQILNLPNRLKAKVGSGDGHLDLAAIARAEAALESLEDQWDDWLKDDLTSLIAAQARFHQEGFTGEIADVLIRGAHDLKGLAPTYHFPLVGRIAAHLCDVLIEAAPQGSLPRIIVDAHVDAIRAAIHDEIRSDADPAGKAILAALAALVRKRMD